MDVREHVYANYTTAQTRLTHSDDLRRHAEEQFAGFRASILPHLPSERHAAILDAGCGYGALLLFLQNEGYTNVHGVDLSTEQVAVAHSLGLHNVRRGNVLDEVSTGAPWDAIVMLDVLEHLTRSEALSLLHVAFEHLNPGGVVIARTPNVDGLFGTVLSFGDITHELHLNVLSARELMAATPFSDVGIHGVDPVGGALSVRLVRAIALPIVRIMARLVAVAAGVSWKMVMWQPNMVIVARKP
jgi:2-polyprenyl-3-methyl-5-hydroxy-6-metoxy-1,4-benzoquinol methylase